VKSYQGQFNLLESAVFASLCKTLVIGDTGLLHMTESLGKEVVGIFGPTPFGLPFLEGSKVVESKLWCSPCSKDGSGPCIRFKYQKCMKDVSPQRVFKEMSDVIHL
jgi:heptosyltransferase-2